MSTGVIKKVAGPLVIASGMRDANMFDVVRVSKQRLIGEIIEIHGDEASIQVYEETSGLGPGEPVESMGVPMSVELGPGLITSIYDGIQRPLDDIMKISGNSLKRGVEVPSLKRDLKWEFVPTVQVGDEVAEGDVFGTVQETIVVQQKIMVPYGVKGKVKEIKSGEFTVEDVVCVVETENGDKELTMMQKLRGPPRTSVSEETAAEDAACNGTACHRYIFPDRKRRCGSGSGTVRKRKDRDPASACEMGGSGHCRVHWMRRAWK